MGGSISITLREPDGTEHRMLRWTNSMPFGITNLGILTDDQKHMEAYLDSWVSMKDDWEANGPKGPFEHNMTEAYFPSRGLAPYGYGLVVIDMVNKVILSSQGYTSIGLMNCAGIGLELLGGQIALEDLDPHSDALRFQQLFEAGRIKSILGWADGKPYEMAVPPEMKFEDLLSECVDRRDWTHFEIDMSPYTVEDLGEGAEALKAMLKRVEELGFDLSDEERATWAEEIKGWEEDY